jgi:hypothetical protein
LEELRRLEGAATVGPWTPQDYDHNPGDQGVPIIGGGEIGSQPGHLTAYTMTLFNEAQSVADAAFIAAARNQLPRILDALDAVLALHAPVQPTSTMRPWVTCAGCTNGGSYPCTTVAAITKALEGKQ